MQIHQRPASCSWFLSFHTLFLNSICKFFAESNAVRDVITAPSPQPILIFQFHLRCPATTTDFQSTNTAGLSHAVGNSSWGKRIRKGWFLCSCVNKQKSLWINITLITDYLECLHSILLVCLHSSHLRLPPQKHLLFWIKLFKCVRRSVLK